MSKIVYSKYQKNLFAMVENSKENLIIQAVAGSGKCLKKGEKIIMYDGSLKQVEDIIIGDLLMGDDSTSRKVLSLTNGVGKLYDIIPLKGKKFTVNEDHILTFKYTNNNRTLKSGNIFDEKLKNILQSKSKIKLNNHNRYDKQWKLFRVPLKFKQSETTFDPYLIGLWLGDGTKNCARIDNPDKEIIKYIEDYCINNNYVFGNVFDSKKNCNRLTISKNKQFDKNKIPNPFLNYVKNKCVDLNNCKTIPNEFIHNSKEVRLKLLAGLLDADGDYDYRKCFNITLKDYEMIMKLKYIILSLGLYCSYSEKKVRLENWDKPRTYHRLNISGNLDIIPTLVKRKQPKKRLMNKDVCKTGWDIKYSGIGEYYGFQLDGNQRFLTEGFIVTHNSTSAVKCLDYIPKNETILFCAFNKAIVENLKEKVPSNVRVSTLHSIGFWLIKQNVGDNRRVNFNKFNEIYEEIVQESTKYVGFFSKEYNKRNFKFYIQQLSNLVKSNNINYNSDDEISELMDFYDISKTRYSFQLVKGAIKQICKKSLDIEKYWIDFSDMIWIPIQLGFYDKFNYIFVDEAQDMNMAQMKLLEHLGGKGTRYIFIGDKNQSIVGFAGSNTSSMNDLKRIFNCKEMPLSICYRCPTSHIENAQRLVPEIEAFDKNPVGTIEDITEHQITHYVKNANDIIICRTNAPLINICLELVRNNIKSYVKGGDIKQSIMKEIKLAERQHKTVPLLRDFFNASVNHIEVEVELAKETLEEELEKSSDSEEKEWKKRQLYYKVRNLYMKQDLYTTILHFCNDNPDMVAISSLIQKVENLFKEDKDSVCCSTIHKAKGLESDNVFILYPHLLPHPLLQGTTEWQIEQEKNVEYVALTRAKSKLYKVWKVDE